MNHPTDCHCDQCLLLQIRSGEASVRQRGWESWYQRDAPVLRAYIERRCQALGYLAYSEDLLHDCFLIGFRNVANGRYSEQERALCAYLYGIVKNLLYEVMRLQGRETVDLEQIDNQADETTLSIEDKIYVEEVVGLVKEAYRQQPPLYQCVMAQLYIEGKSSQDVAAELQKTAGNIRAIARRAVHQIINHLARYHDVHLSSHTIRACLLCA